MTSLALHAAYLAPAGLATAPRRLRDLKLLESAVHRPQMAAHYEGADLVRQAALLGAGIIQNHPWHDGNKRGAYIAIVNFLDQNGLAVRSPEAEPVGPGGAVRGHCHRRSEGIRSPAGESLETWLRAQRGGSPGKEFPFQRTYVGDTRLATE